MSYIHYLTSQAPLPTGSFGSFSVKIETLSRISHDTVLVNGKLVHNIGVLATLNWDLETLKRRLVIYEHPEDMAGLYIMACEEDPHPISIHTTNPYRYEVQANGGNFIDQHCKQPLNHQCRKKLVKFIEDQLKPGQYMEFITTWIGEESMPMVLTQDVYISELEDLCHLKIQDKTYIRFYKK